MIGKDKIVLIFAIVCILVAAIIFYYSNVIIPNACEKVEWQVRKELDENAMPKGKVAVVTGSEGIARYTVLTEEIINKNIKIIEIPVKYIANQTVNDADQLIGKITKENLRVGEQIILNSLSNDKKWFGEFDRLKEYEVDSIVAGEVKSGNIVDIIVNYGNGTYDVVVPKMKIQKLVNQDQISRNGKQNEESYTIILSVDEEQYRDLEMANTLGRLETRLYLDESQSESVKTFDCDTACGEKNKPAIVSGGSK